VEAAGRAGQGKATRRDAALLQLLLQSGQKSTRKGGAAQVARAAT
jgi:hypothetical protein